MRLLSVLPIACVLLHGCALAANPGDPATVVLTVRNRATAPLSTTVCGPMACSAPRTLASGARSRFLVEPGSGSRAVVTAKRGDRVVAQKPVDFSPGDRIAVNIDIEQ